MNKIFSGLLVSDFTMDNFSQVLKHKNIFPLIDTTITPYGEFMSVLLDPNHVLRKKKYDFVIIWTQPHSISESFKDLLYGKNVDIDLIMNQVEQFAMFLSNIKSVVKFVFIPTWVIPSYIHGLGMLNMKPKIGISAVLMQMNLALANYFENDPSFFVLDAQRWLTEIGPKAFNPKLWYMAKIPFTNDVFAQASQDIKSALRGLSGDAKKLIIVDLDNTLWGGIVGDDGWEKLTLGGHSYAGEAYADFQRSLKALKEKGVLIAIVSKNDEQVALEAIEKHPEMILHKDDFVGWRINWGDKAQNIVDLVSDLNLGLQSVVFFDDNPSERARVREELSEVFVPDLPNDPMLYTYTLQKLNCFDAPFISKEDRERTSLYAAEKKRIAIRQRVSSVDSWLEKLDMHITISTVNKTNLKRTVQLLNKTNQMNLTTRRLSEEELVVWLSDKNHFMRVINVSDKFGDFGLVGIFSFEILESRARFVDFVLSCRVFGRKIEELMVQAACQNAQKRDLLYIEAVYEKTAKNKPCFDFWKRSGFDYNESDKRFLWDFKKDYPINLNAKIDEKNE